MPAGLRVREVALRIVIGITANGQSTDDAVTTAFRSADTLDARDRAAARRIAMATVRRFHSLDATVKTYLERGYPKRSGTLRDILIVAAAQLILLAAPAHAVIDLAVRHVRGERRAAPFAGLANAVLRRLSETGTERFTQQDAFALDIPVWLQHSWSAVYGADLARDIAQASLHEAALDITVKDDANAWAERLEGFVTPTGTVRRANSGRISELPGFADGSWWVQDAAAAIPARLFGDVAGRDVLDLCAAPGGKTAQLSAFGANVTALDWSERRLERLNDNMRRLGFKPEVVCADAMTWQPNTLFDAVLVDAPCSATGTLRRNPDILHHQSSRDLAALAERQEALLRRAVAFVRPGGTIVYCTCSLQPDEGPDIIARVLTDTPNVRRLAVTEGTDLIPATFVTLDGDVRTFPTHFPHERPELSGLDGFYTARLRRVE